MFIAPFPGSGLSYNFLQSNTQSSTTGTVTFTGVSFGSVISPQRYIIISVAWVSPSNTLSSATIGGVSATINVQYNNIAGRTAIIIANVPTGTSGTVILNFTGSATDILASTYALIGLSNPTPTVTASNSSNNVHVSLSVNSGQIIIGVALSGATASSWSGLNQDSSNAFGGVLDTGASIQVTSTNASYAITCTFTSGSTSNGSFAVYGP